jgi:alginate O-acetyltransferase complex protein AlgI
MLFTSFVFFVLLLISLFFYYLPNISSSRWQVFILIAAGFIFYAYNNLSLLILLLISILMNVIISYFIFYSTSGKRKLYAVMGVIFNLAIICFFKYSPLISKTFFNPSDPVGSFLLLIPLPIGISFYTFEGITLVVDSFKAENEDRYRSLVSKSFMKHLMDTTVFITFFPHLIAGPIVKAHDFLPQIKIKYFKEINWNYCISKLIVGYFFKMVIADNLNIITSEMLVPAYHSSITLVLLLFAYSMQIFADFAGYSLIALGLAGLFGYTLIENFNFPYISRSFSEFWTRWHISLSTFLKEYLYFPLGGNKKGQIRTYFNLLIVMVLGGIWHGASWSYAVWGLFHGLSLAIERFINNTFGIDNTKEARHGILRTIFKTFFVFSLVSCGWLLFRLPDFESVIDYFRAMFTNVSFYPMVNLALAIPIVFYSAPIIIYHFAYLISLKEKKGRSDRFTWLMPISYSLMLFLILTASGNAGSFIYFQF